MPSLNPGHIGASLRSVTRSEGARVAHASIDTIFSRELSIPRHAGDGIALESYFATQELRERRSGTELFTHIEHRGSDGCVVCQSRWGCVVQGLELSSPLDPAKYLTPAATAWPPLPSSATLSNGGASNLNRRVSAVLTLSISPTAAHIWEACIQDPTHGRQLREIVSPHTDAEVSANSLPLSFYPWLRFRSVRARHTVCGIAGSSDSRLATPHSDRCFPAWASHRCPYATPPNTASRPSAAADRFE